MSKTETETPKKYVVMHDVRHNGDRFSRGAEIEILPSLVKKLDPEGHVFLTPEKYAAKTKLAEAQAEVAKLEKSEEKKGGK